MKQSWIGLGAFWSGLAVALGAFGAHGLKSLEPSPEALKWWNTAADYHFGHGLALIMFGLFARGSSPQVGSAPAKLLFMGSAIFSGALYAMGLGAPRWFGAIAPIGGALMILGWALFARAAYRQSG